MKPSPETLKHIAAHIRDTGKIPSLEAYTWTTSHINCLIAAVNDYRDAHDGREVVGIKALHDLIQETHRTTKPDPKRPMAPTGWRKNLAAVEGGAVETNRRRH